MYQLDIVTLTVHIEEWIDALSSYPLTGFSADQLIICVGPLIFWTGFD